MPLDSDSPVPLYRQLAAELRAVIFSGAYEQGRRLTERELIEQWGVSRVTVREALAVLRAEGLIEATPGRGTYVTGPAPLRLLFSRYSGRTGVGPFTQAARDQGREGEMRLVAVEHLAATAEVAARLGLASGAPVVLRHRHGLLDGHVAEVQRSYFPLAVVEGTPLASEGFIERGTLATLEAIGRPAATVTEELTAALPDEGERATLGAGPVLRTVRLARDAAGVALEVRYASARYGLSYAYEDLPVPTREEPRP